MRRRCSARTRRRRRAAVHPAVPARSRPSVHVRFDPRASAGRPALRARLRSSPPSACRRTHTVAFDRRRARLSDRRRGAGEPAADVRRVLGADGAAERHPAHEAARRRTAGRFRARSCRSTTSSGVPITRGSRRSSIRAGSRTASCRTSRWGARSTAGAHGDARHQPRVARRARPAAEGGVPARAARRAAPTTSRSTPPRGASSRRRPGGRDAARRHVSRSRSTTAC